MRISSWASYSLNTPALRLRRSGGGGREEESKKMPKGKVKWFNDQKGYGFITPDDGSKDLFVHHSSVEGEGFKTLSEGQEVEFEMTQSDKGPKAANVKKIS